MVDIERCKKFLRTQCVIESLEALLQKYKIEEVREIYKTCNRSKKRVKGHKGYPDHYSRIVKFVVFGEGSFEEFDETWQDVVEPYLLFVYWVKWRKSKGDRIEGVGMTYKELEEATGMDDLRYWNLEKDAKRVFKERWKD